jgi:importin-5
MLLSCGEQSGILTAEHVSATLMQLISCLGTEEDASFLSSLYRCLLDCLRVVGGPQGLSPQYQSGLIEATKRQLQRLAERRKVRSAQPRSEYDEDRQEELAMLEEMEDFALEDMSRLLEYCEPNHPLMIAVSSVKALGMNKFSDEDDE